MSERWALLSSEISDPHSRSQYTDICGELGNNVVIRVPAANRVNSCAMTVLCSMFTLREYTGRIDLFKAATAPRPRNIGIFRPAYTVSRVTW